jgi:hypothetical protein
MKLNSLIAISATLLLSCSVIATSCSSEQETQSKTKFYSADAREANIAFSTWFRFPKDQIEYEYTDIDDSNGQVTLYETDLEKVDEALKLDTLFLYGVFTYHQKPTDFYEHPGTVDDFAASKITSIKEDPDGIHLLVSFDYSHYGVFYGDMFAGKKKIKRSFYMPNNPATVYKDGFPKKPRIDPKTKKPINPCSDIHDNTELAFWYYWSPDRKGCPTKFKKSLHLVEATFTKKPMTKKTFPEYKKLYTQNEDGSLNINFIIGVDEKFRRRSDLGRKTFENLKKRFAGLVHEDGTSIFKENKADSSAKIHKFLYKTDQFDAYINLHFVDPDHDNWDEFIGDIMIESDVMVYAGHSAEGYYFDPGRIFDETGREFIPKKYQIIFMDSCTSWSYFNKNYFDFKSTPRSDPKGTKYLDFVTNAIGAPFLADADSKHLSTSVSRPSNSYFLVMSLLGMKADGSPLKKLNSWQNILDNITGNSGYYDTALTNVIGDRDNPTKLPSSQKVPKSL